MENYDYNILKKRYGEKFARLCRKLFPTIIEKKGLLSSIITKRFADNKFLYDDIVSANLENDFKEHIYSFMEHDSDFKDDTIENPYELMEKAGYTLYRCETEEDINKFVKYYAPDEEICTFHDGDRTEFYHVFFAVKDNALGLDREDFKNPLRQDEYGTSVISIQFAKLSVNNYFITNRYNHIVENPDATFSNDLNNIIPGLSKSFENEFGFVFETEKKGFHIPNYTIASNGKQYKINARIDGNKLGVNNELIDRYGSVTEFNKDNYLLFDYFLLNLSNGSIETLVDLYDRDAFLDGFKDVSKVQVEKHKDGKILTLSTTSGKDFFIELNKYNSMVKYTNENIVKIKNNFLKFIKNLKEINLPNVEEIGNEFLFSANNIKKINFPNLKIVGNGFMAVNQNLYEINAENLMIAGQSFLRANTNITKINFPKLNKAAADFMFYNEKTTEVNLPSLQEVGRGFLQFHPKSKEILETLLADKARTEQEKTEKTK